MLQGLRTVIYASPDLGRAKAWYAEVLGINPYFDEPFYVGFSVGGFELGLVPDAIPGAAGARAYWGVPDAAAALARLLSLGAEEHEPVTEVGGGIKVASVLDVSGNVLGVIENPAFKPADMR